MVLQARFEATPVSGFVLLNISERKVSENDCSRIFESMCTSTGSCSSASSTRLTISMHSKDFLRAQEKSTVCSSCAVVSECSASFCFGCVIITSSFFDDDFDEAFATLFVLASFFSDAGCF